MPSPLLKVVLRPVHHLQAGGASRQQPPARQVQAGSTRQSAAWPSPLLTSSKRKENATRQRNTRASTQVGVSRTEPWRPAAPPPPLCAEGHFGSGGGVGGRLGQGLLCRSALLCCMDA